LLKVAPPSVFSSAVLTVRLIDSVIGSPGNDEPEPFNTLQKAFSSYGPVERQFFQPLLVLLERLALPEGHVLFSQGDRPDGLYIIQAGVLRASYAFADFTPRIEESMVPGTLAGELSMLSGEPRNATCVVEREAVVWRLSEESLETLQEKEPELARTFTRMVLKGECFFPPLLGGERLLNISTYSCED
jgi:SulP family sulfate permease